jgi:hypothetical protein
MTDPIILTHETNARFWEQTAYKPNRNLDMLNPLDRKFAKLWLVIYQMVKVEDTSGRLVLTYQR